MANKMIKKKTVNKIIYGVGISVVFLSHIAIITWGMPQDMIFKHAITNLVAGSMIAYSYITK